MKKHKEREREKKEGGRTYLSDDVDGVISTSTLTLLSVKRGKISLVSEKPDHHIVARSVVEDG